MLTRGDDEPAGVRNGNGKHKKSSYCKVHKGSYFHHNPLFNIEPADWIPCILHLLLRVVELMFKHTIMCKVTEEKMAARVHTYLQEHQVHIKKFAAVSRGEKPFLSSIKRHSFKGRDCAALLNCFSGLLDLVYGDCRIAVLLKQKRKAVAMWEAWVDCWGFLSSQNDQGETNAERAATVAKTSQKWGKAFRLATSTSGGLYFHILMSHTYSSFDSEMGLFRDIFSTRSRVWSFCA